VIAWLLPLPLLGRLLLMWQDGSVNATPGLQQWQQSGRQLKKDGASRQHTGLQNHHCTEPLKHP